MCAATSVGEKMASSRNDHLIKQRSVIEFLTAEGCSAVVIHKRMKAVYGDACLTEGKVQKWARFYRGEDPKETTVRDRKRPGRPVSATDTMHQQKEDEMIVANRRVKQKDIANALDISKERVHHIITVHLGYRKVSARWIPRLDSSLWKRRHRGKRSEHNCWKDSLMTASVFCGASSLVTSLGCITMTQRERCSLCSTHTRTLQPRRSSKSSHQLERFC